MDKLAHVVGAVDNPLLEESVGVNLRRVSRAVPDNDAVVDALTGVRLSYAELVRAVDRLACSLIARGISPGDRVGVWSPNRVESVIAQFAIASVGGVLVGINPSYLQGELDYLLRQAEIALVISAPGHRGSDFGEMLERAQSAGWRGRFVMLDEAWDRFLDEGTDVGPDALAERVASVSPDAPFCLQYTSGTTGRPKAATITHRAAVNQGRFIGMTMAFTERDRLCVCLPFFHAFGIIACNLACATAGAAIVLSGPTFDVDAVLAAVERERCTALHGVPTMFIAELNSPTFAERDLSSLRTGLMGGAPCPVEVVQAVIERMHMSELTVGFGMSELGSVTTQTAVSDPIERKVGTVGRIHPHLEAKIVDEAGRTVLVGQAGELAVRGYACMTGYWNDPERTAEVVDRDGWVRSGDLAVVDAAGYVQIVGRIKDMIVRGGENVYPREIEEVLHAHSDVVEAYVIGIPDPVYGESIVAVVHLREDGNASGEALRDHCRGSLAHYKVPQRVVFRSGFPTTASGKVRKAELRDQVLEEIAGPDAGE